MTSQDLLALALKRLNCTPYKLSVLLDTRSGEIYKVRAGKKTFSDRDLFTLCDLIDEPYEKWLPVIEAERSKNPKERAAWEAIAKVTSTAFALLLVVSSLINPSPAQAAEHPAEPTTTYYDKLRDLLVRLLESCGFGLLARSPYFGTFCACIMSALIPGSAGHNL